MDHGQAAALRAIAGTDPVVFVEGAAGHIRGWWLWLANVAAVVVVVRLFIG